MAVKPTREELRKFLPSQRAIRAFEALFDIAPEGIDESVTAANTAGATANLALGQLTRIAQALELLATAPPGTPDIDAEDVAPPASQQVGAQDLEPPVSSQVSAEDLAPSSSAATEADDLSPPIVLGTIAPQNAENVSITGGSVSATLTDDTANLIASSQALSDGAAAAAGTLTNAPSAGDPSKWVAIDDNGSTLYLPAWS